MKNFNKKSNLKARIFFYTLVLFLIAFVMVWIIFNDEIKSLTTMPPEVELIQIKTIAIMEEQEYEGNFALSINKHTVRELKDGTISGITKFSTEIDEDIITVDWEKINNMIYIKKIKTNNDKIIFNSE